jgi:hypothetical protein
VPATGNLRGAGADNHIRRDMDLTLHHGRVALGTALASVALCGMLTA